MTKEEEILKAAEEEFFAGGYDSTSTATIAKRAGVTHAMVNYYFRTKEKLFMKILDNHVSDLLHRLKPLMQADGNVAEVATTAAAVIFDKFNEDRRLPFIISDISRTHPDFLMRYKETVDTVCKDSVRMHSERLEKGISEGRVAPCTMNDIYNAVLELSAGPFLTLPVLENVAGFSPERTEAFLAERKEEMVRMLQARFATTQKD
ncbi:MAG: TetR/AcrR family transcriptional regulator [Bacteroidales bacterium]|nr:TetR/AcrR family transcriptional regulator [Bacteroidales bacterium]